jgi:hypothetical protein
VFTCAEDKEDARDSVESWLDEYLGREFYDGYRIGETVHRSEIHHSYFDKEWTRVEDMLDRQREEAEKYRRGKDRQGEGQAHHIAANILLERLCPEMPWFNRDTWDWSLPDKDGELEGEQDNWWAIEVTFHD